MTTPELRRWTPFTALVPGRYVDRDPWWADFDFETWSAAAYEWTGDGWHGYRDFARRPRDTVAAGRGDCEDYALVALSWAVARGHPGTGLAFCWALPWPWPRHVVAFDDECVYSSGSVSETDVDSWLADSRYDAALRRRVR